MELVIDRGVKSYDVKDVDGTLLGVIKINPADIGISGRFVSARNAIAELAEQAKQDMTPEKILAMDTTIKAELNKVFGSDVSSVFFGGLSALALADDGAFVFEKVLEAVDGGVYDTHVASLAAEILSGYPYTLDTVLGEERIQGYIPAGTRREALQQLAFAIGAVVDCSRGEIIRIVPAPQRASGLIGTDRRLQDGSKVTLLTLVTAVSVTAHRYIPGEASEELYKDTLEPGTYRVTFDAPAVADSLAVRGAELSERGVNHCTLTVSKAAEVCVTGRKYSDSATVLRREASNLPSNAQGNEVSVPDATLVSPDRAAAVAARVLDYYAQRYEQTFRMVAGDEKLADRLIVESFGGEMVRGVVTKLEFDLTGGFLADAKIVGRKLSNNAAAYAGEEIHAGERSFI